MTRVTTGYIHHIANFVLTEKRESQRLLIGETYPIHDHRLRAGRRLIAHIEYLIARAQIILRRAVTTHTPSHLQRLLLIHQRHLIDRTVAGIAAHPFGDMNAVIEKDKVGELIDPRPLQRFAGAVAGAHRLEHGRVRPNLRMAVHAGLGGGNACEARNLDRGVAVAAIDSQPGYMVLVAEGHRLRLAHACVGYIRRALYFITDPAERGHYEDRAKDRDPCQRIRTTVKGLWHYE